MYQQFIMDFFTAVMGIFAAVFASGWITTAITQVLKLEWIAVPAQKYPTVVAIVVSLLVSIPAIFLTGIINLDGSWYMYALFAASTLFVSTKTYDIVHAAIVQIKTRGLEKE